MMDELVLKKISFVIQFDQFDLPQTECSVDQWLQKAIWLLKTIQKLSETSFNEPVNLLGHRETTEKKN